LTHDYLVPPLRDWLTRKQKETRRGRAELLLADRAAVWNGCPENRHLPSPWQWLQIRWLTQQHNWTPPQRKMMRKAARVHALRGTVLAIALVVLTLTGWEGFGRLKAHGLCDRLLNADIADVPTIVNDIEFYRHWVNPLLQDASVEAEQEHDTRKQLRSSLALLPVDSNQFDSLYERLLTAGPEELRVIRDTLKGQPATLVERLQRVLGSAEEDPERRLRAACALAGCEGARTAEANGCWQAASTLIVNELLAAVQRNPSHFSLLVDLLRPARNQLLAPLAAIYRSKERSERERSLAASVLAEYAADQPDFLTQLVLDGDADQFAVLFAKLKEGGDRGLAVLNKELSKTLGPQWNDAPLDPSWKEPAAALRERIEAADGLLQERFALCQTLPLADCLSVAEELRESGYRPSRLRPYAVGNAVHVAAVWIRDGQPWRLAYGLSAEALRQHDEANRKEGYLPGDVSSYLVAATETYAAVWSPAPAKGSLAQLEIGLPGRAFKAKAQALFQEGYQLAILSTLPSTHRKLRHTAIWAKAPGQTAPDSDPRLPGHYLDKWFTGTELDYAGENHLGDLQVDVQLTKAGPVPSPQEHYAQQLKDVENDLQAKPNDANLRLRRAVAYSNLDELDKALQDLSWLVEKSPGDATGYEQRAVVYARLGKTMEAKADVARFQALSSDLRLQAYLDAVVSAYLGEDAEGMQRLEAALAATAKHADWLYTAARAFAVASQAVRGKNAAQAKRYADRAVALLQEALASGFSDWLWMQTIADLDPIRQDPRYLALLDRAKLDRQYVAVWHANARFTSTELHGLAPGAHLARCRQLLADNYRPVSLSVTETRTGEPLVTASVWQRPVVPDEEKEHLAKRQATAAVALLRLGQGEKVWPLLKHRLHPAPDPRMRSYLIHRLSPMGADPRTLCKQLEEEQDVSIRRALLLSLGEFRPEQFSLAQREALVPKLLEWYSQDPDPGLHAAVEWLLRQWQQEQRLAPISEAWSKDAPQRQQRLARIKQELTRDQPPAAPQWYVNGQGHTMVVIPGPVEFLMGSPHTEAGRFPLELLHRRRIGRTFAIAAKEVTVEQFLKFRSDHPYSKRDLPTANVPMNQVRWYDAAAYCNWLSKQEGIPPEQWCYLPDGTGEYRQGMKLAPNYLQREGYRLPSEAEWEYACRSGAFTSRSYGETDELLGKYAWFWKSSMDYSQLPAGTLKPNDLGLFDMLGNIEEWCQDTADAYMLGQGGKASMDMEFTKDIRDTQVQVLRGGPSIPRPQYLRSACRSSSMPPIYHSAVGFRPARTLTPE
jgi:formylglycine-generating enzyme required for sulfatase activity